MLAIDLPEHGARQGEKNRFNPWTVVPELKTVFAYMKHRWSEIGVCAHSIGTHFSMLALDGEALCSALLSRLSWIWGRRDRVGASIQR